MHLPDKSRSQKQSFCKITIHHDRVNLWEDTYTLKGLQQDRLLKGQQPSFPVVCLLSHDHVHADVLLEVLLEQGEATCQVILIVLLVDPNPIASSHFLLLRLEHHGFC